MSSLQFRLFGKFRVQRDSQLLDGFDSGKEQELLSYLLVHRNRSHPREALAGMLWGNTSTERSKKYLRQALWHLHAAFEVIQLRCPPVLVVEHDWVQLNLHHHIWLDVAVFEQACAATQGVSGKHLDRAGAEKLKEAVDLYRGDLLGGWYHDWCLFERERFQNAYLLMLDKLMSYAVEHREYELGQDYGVRILQIDRASERTYRRLMQLQHMAGDRTSALRQYQRCLTALDEELGVKPERRTRDLYEQIRADKLDRINAPRADAGVASLSTMSEMLGRLKRLQLSVATVQRRLQNDISAVEDAVKMKTTKT
jgi:DNA-binding SARP family transcriptional activator